MSSYRGSPTLQELLAGLPDDRLDARVSDSDLETLARSLKSWRGVAPYLGLTEAEEEDIVSDNRRHQRQKSAALRKWREKEGDGATYRNLAKAFHKNGFIDTVEMIRQILSTPETALGGLSHQPNIFHMQGTKWWILVPMLVAIVAILITWLAMHGITTSIKHAPAPFTTYHPLATTTTSHHSDMPAQHAPSSTPPTDCQPMSLTLRAPVEHFIGRDAEIEKIIENLMNFRIVSIVGPPGFGKSALAIMVGHQLMNEGNTIIYINLNKVMDLNDIMLWVLHGVDITDATGDRMVEQKFRKWASTLACPVVIILDGCDAMFHHNNNELHQSINTLSESTHHIRILTTSRTRLPLTYASCIGLDQLPLNSAMTLLGKLHPPLNSTQSERIVEVTGGMPLALMIIGTLLNYVIFPENLITELQDQQNLLTTLSHPDLPAELQLESCIEYSYSKLDHQLQMLSQLLAQFPISFTAHAGCCIVTGNCESSVKYTVLPENASEGMGDREPVHLEGYILINLTLDDCREQLNELVMRSLLQFESQRYFFHKFIRDFLHKFQQDNMNKVMNWFDFSFAAYHWHREVTGMHIRSIEDTINGMYTLDIIIKQSWYPFYNWILEGFWKSKKFTIKAFYTVHPSSLRLINESMLQCSQENYTGCANLLKQVLEQTPSSESTISKIINFRFLLNVYDPHIGNELVLEVLEQQGDRLFPLLMSMPNSELLEAQLFNEVLVNLQNFYFKTGRTEWACTLIEKNVEVWNSSNHTMDTSLENTTLEYPVTCCAQRNITAMMRIREALFEHRRRVEKRIVEDTAERNAKHFISDNAEWDKKIWKVNMIQMELQMDVCSVNCCETICVRDDVSTSLWELMYDIITEWEQLPHQLLEGFMGQVYYKAVKRAMDQYRNVWARIRSCTCKRGEAIESIAAANLQMKISAPWEWWADIQQWMSLAQGLDSLGLNRKEEMDVRAKIGCIVKVRTLDIVDKLMDDTLQLLRHDGMPRWVWNEFYRFFEGQEKAEDSVSSSCTDNYEAYASELKINYTRFFHSP